MSRTVAMSRFAPASLRMQNSFLGAAAPSLTERRNVTREIARPGRVTAAI